MIVGLTGGIGSGKSEVSRRFEQLGIEVVDADLVAREVVGVGSDALAVIANRFGQDILNGDGSLNRSLLRSIIFNNPNHKRWLENLLHPIIRHEIIKQLNQSASPYSILCSPLLFETEQNKLVRRVLVVDATETEQLQRATQRDTNNQEQIQKIMATQLGRLERRQRADDIIENHSDLSALSDAVNRLHKMYLKLAHQPSTQY